MHSLPAANYECTEEVGCRQLYEMGSGIICRLNRAFVEACFIMILGRKIYNFIQMIAIETQMDKKHKIGDKKLTVEYTEIIIIILICFQNI